MGRKNTFKPDIFTSIKAYIQYEYSEYIEWIDNISIDEYIKLSLSKNVSVSEPKQDYIIVGRFEINSCLKVDTESKHYGFLITDPEYKTINVSIGYTDPVFWYTFDNRKDFFNSFNVIYDSYNPKEYLVEYPNCTRGFGGSESVLKATIDDVERYIITNHNTEILIWGSMWKDHPFRNEYSGEVSRLDNIMMIDTSMKQINSHTYHINVRSKYSKSIITVEYYDGVYVINVKYTPVLPEQTEHISNINKVLERYFPTDIPVDVVMAMSGLVFITADELIKLDDISDNNFISALLVANCSKLYDDVVDEIDKLVEQTDSKTVKNMCIFYKDIFKVNSKLDTILTDKEVEKCIFENIDDINNNKKNTDTAVNCIIVKIKEVYTDLDSDIWKKLDFTKKLESAIYGII